MKKTKILFVAVVLGTATLTGSIALQKQSVVEFRLTGMEALASSESDSDQVTCRCQNGFLSNMKCLESNSDSICAYQTNLPCSNFNSECY